MAGNNILIFDYATNRGPKQCKLQDSRGMKFFPMLLELTEEPISEDAAFAEKLQRLGALESGVSYARFVTRLPMNMKMPQH